MGSECMGSDVGDLIIGRKGKRKLVYLLPLDHLLSCILDHLLSCILQYVCLFIYVCVSYSDKTGRMSEANGTDVSIDVRSFKGATMLVKVKKRPGMEKMNLLASEGQNQKANGPEEPDSNIWDTLSRLG